nr:MAG TPA: hypothetical protein [Caudoviricetes sp.]
MRLVSHTKSGWFPSGASILTCNLLTKGLKNETF